MALVPTDSWGYNCDRDRVRRASVLEKTMNRSAVIALATIIGWGAGLATAGAGEVETHSPKHRADRPIVTSRQVGIAPTERHKTKQTLNNSRHSIHADRVGTLRQVGTAPAERHKTKQSANQSKSSIVADKAGTKHAYRSRAADRHVAKQTVHNARHFSHSTRLEAKHRSQLASRGYHNLKRGVKSSHVAAKKAPIGDKQPHRRAATRKT
jgi:hypothetical protein